MIIDPAAVGGDEDEDGSRRRSAVRSFGGNATTAATAATAAAAAAAADTSRRAAAGERRRQQQQQQQQPRKGFRLDPRVMALLLVGGIVSLAQTSKRLCACHAFLFASSRRQQRWDPTTTKTTALFRRSFETRVRLRQAKDKAAETKPGTRRGNAADEQRRGRRLLDDDDDDEEEDRRQRQQQQHDEFVEVGRQSFAQYFAYDLDGWQLEAGGAIASGHNVIVCGAYSYRQTTNRSTAYGCCCNPSLTVVFFFSY
jgi:superfamily II RNA helicase